MIEAQRQFSTALREAGFETLRAESALQVCVSSVASTMGCDVASLYAFDGERGELTLIATVGLAPSAVGFVTLALGEGVTGWAAETGKPYSVPDVTQDTRYQIIPGFDQSGFRSILAVPVLLESTLIGALNVQTVAVHEYDDHEVQRLLCLAELVAPLFGRWHDDTAARRLRGPKLLSMVQGMAAASLAPRELCEQLIDGLRAVLTAVECGVRLDSDSGVDWIGTPIAGAEGVITIPLRGDTQLCGVLALRYQGSGVPPWQNAPAWQYVQRLTGQFGIALEHALKATARSGALGDAETYDSLVSVVLAGEGLDALVEQIVRRTSASVAVVDSFETLLAGEAEGADLLDVPIVAGDQRLGSLRVSPPSVPRSVLDAAAHVLALELTKGRVGFEVEMRLRVDLLEMLLDDDGVNPRELVARASLSGLDLRQAYTPVMFAVDPEAAVWQNQLALRSLVDRVQRRFGDAPRCVVFQRADGLLALVAAQREAEPQLIYTAENVADEMARLMGGSSVGIGLGRPTIWPDGFRRELRTTARAGEYSRTTGIRKVIRGDALGVQSLLVSMEVEALDDYVRSQLGALIDQDARTGGNLVDTLEAYFLAGDRLNAAAERLYIHVNTMKYRIARIQALTDDALSLPTRRHDLYLALQALRVLHPERDSLLYDGPGSK